MHGHPPTLTLPRKGGGDTTAGAGRAQCRFISSSLSTVSISSSFAAAGVPVERGGTAIQNILIAIEEAAADGGDKLQLFATIAGLAVDEFRKLQDADPGIAFTRVIEGLRGVENVLPPGVLRSPRASPARRGPAELRSGKDASAG